MAAVDLTGKRFGKLAVIRRLGKVPEFKRGFAWLLRCDCGNEITATPSSLKGRRKSCGCKTTNRVHGLTGTRIFRLWGSMRGRCRQDSNYTSKGIKVCPEWDDAEAFANWAFANGYAPGLQIDRIDNNGDYSPSNCRFVTPEVNMNNRDVCTKFRFLGESLTLAQAGRKYGFAPNSLRHRLNAGMTPDEAVTHPKRPGRWTPLFAAPQRNRP